MKKLLLSALTACALTCAPAFASDDIRVEQVHFADGATGIKLSDSITGYESVAYKINAEAGQRMRVRLMPSNLSSYFNVYGPGKGPGDAAMANASLTSDMVPDLNVFDFTLPMSGEYTVSVYMMRNAARRGETSDYKITFSIEGAAVATGQSD